MSLSTYDPSDDSNAIIHTVNIDLVLRPAKQNIIHVVQYDDKLPVVEVELYKNNNVYTVPQDAEVYIRCESFVNSGIYKEALGCSENRDKVYFTIDETMVNEYGDKVIVIEIIVNEEFTDGDGETYDKRIACSSPLYLKVDKNPIQKMDLNYQVPTTPSLEDGTYVLEATVLNGVITYNWVLKS